MAVKQGKRIMRVGAMLAVAAGLVGPIAACGKSPLTREKVVTFQGQSFRSAATPNAQDRSRFVATARNPGKSIEGAIEAATYQGTKYCIQTFGTSDILWAVGPDTPQSQMAITSDSLTLSGQCRDQ